MSARAPVVTRAPRRGRVRQVALLASMAIAVLGGRAHAASPPPFAIEIDQQQAIFQLGALSPGPVGQRCLVLAVRNGSADEAVLSAQVGGTGLASYLDLTIEVGTSADPATCTGFTGSTAFQGTIAQLGATHADPATGVPLPFPATNGAVVRFTLSLQDDNGAQGRTATLALRFDVTDTTGAPPTTTAPTTTAPPTTTVAPATTSATAATTPPTTAAPGATTTQATTTTASVEGTAGAAGTRPPRGSTPATTTARTTEPATSTPSVDPSGASGEIEVRDPTRAPDERSVAEQAVAVVGKTVTVAAKTSVVPATFGSFVLLFLVVQDRFDRNDPKLRHAPFAPEPELAYFARGSVGR